MVRIQSRGTPGSQGSVDDIPGLKRGEKSESADSGDVCVDHGQDLRGRNSVRSRFEEGNSQKFGWACHFDRMGSWTRFQNTIPFYTEPVCRGISSCGHPNRDPMPSLLGFCLQLYSPPRHWREVPARTPSWGSRGSLSAIQT